MRIATRSAVLAFVLSGFLALPARAEEDAQLALCRYVEGRVEQLVQVGDIDRAREFRPQLQSCIDRRKTDSLRHARQLVQAYDRAAAEALRKDHSRGH